jgi:hypothetical protein
MKLGKDLAVVLLVGVVSVACSGGSGEILGGVNDDAGVTGQTGAYDSGMKASSSGDASPPTWSGSEEDAGQADAGDVGVDAGGPSCHGTPTPCDLLVSCTTAGCTSTTGGCSGVSTACFEIFSSFGCGSQQGCYWNATSNVCSGLSFLCTEITSQTSCVLDQGCSWSASSCTGIPAVSCALADTSGECGTIEGCFWD